MLCYLKMLCCLRRYEGINQLNILTTILNKSNNAENMENTDRLQFSRNSRTVNEGLQHFY